MDSEGSDETRKERISTLQSEIDTIKSNKWIGKVDVISLTRYPGMYRAFFPEGGIQIGSSSEIAERIFEAEKKT